MKNPFTKTALSAWGCIAVAAVAAPADVAREAPEVDFDAALQALVAAQPQRSLEQLDDILRRHPNFRIAAMLRADLLAARAGQPALLPLPEAGAKTRIADLLDEAKARTRHRPAPAGKLPANILRLSARHRHALLFDAARSRLYLFQNGTQTPTLIADYYAAHGKGGMDKRSEGDKRTPTGVYKITRAMDDAQLAELYGVGAYPLDYPNAWDRLRRHSGHGIWLHGVPRVTYSRPPRTSRGCVVASNEVVRQLRRQTRLTNLPVILAERVVWIEAEAWRRRQRELLDAIGRWQGDWQSLDTDRYLSHYSSDYRDREENYRELEARVRHNARAKTFVKVGVSNVDLLLYSHDPQLVVARFDQDYRSNNYGTAYRKQQFWRAEDGVWKIVFEGRV